MASEVCYATVFSAICLVTAAHKFNHKLVHKQIPLTNGGLSKAIERCS
jgi:hypothetical protein